MPNILLQRSKVKYGDVRGITVIYGKSQHFIILSPEQPYSVFVVEGSGNNDNSTNSIFHVTVYYSTSIN